MKRTEELEANLTLFGCLGTPLLGWMGAWVWVLRSADVSLGIAVPVNLTRLARAWGEYKADHNDKPLPEKSWQVALAPYPPPKSQLKCPDSKGGYCYEAGRGGVLFTEAKPAHKGHRTTVFTDGTIRLMKVSALPLGPALVARE
jgi:hypothetical protein